MDFYHPQATFKGKLKCDSAPTANTDVTRKQDIAGLSFISSIAAGSSDLISVSGGALTVDSLLISSVKVNSSAASLAAYFSGNQTEANGLKEGDFLVLTGVAAGTETYICKTQPGSGNQVASNMVSVESGLTTADILAKISDGEGININSSGVISTDIVAGAGINKTVNSGQVTLAVNATTDGISEGSSNLYHTSARVRSAVSNGGDLAYNSSTGQFSVTTFKTADARAAVSSGGDLTYNSSTGQFSVTKFTAAEARSSISVSGDLAYNSSTGVLSATKYTDTNARAAFSAAGDLAYNSSTGQFSVTKFTQANARASVSASGDLSYANATGVFSVTTYKSSNFNTDFTAKSTADLSENAANKYFTDARARTAISATGDVTYTSATGVINVVTYKSSNFNTDFNAKSTTNLSEGTNLYYTDARAQNAISGGNGIAKTAGGALSVDLKGGKDGLKFDGDKLSIDKADFRHTTTTNLSANTWTTITHNLGEAPLHVSVWSSTGDLIQVDCRKGTGLQALNQIQIRSVSALSNAEILVGI